MAKYIDADTVVSMPFLDDSYGIEKHTMETDTIENLLDRFTKEGCPEPVDVAQIRHSRWIKTETLTIAISALEKQEADRWIPVTERLPETDRDKWLTEFIVTTEDGEVMSMDWENTNVRNKPVSRWTWRGKISPWKVVAWCPLPEPYTEEEA